MLEVADALAIVLERARPLEPRLEPLSPALLHRILAVEARADRDSPPFDKSLRDGYAVRSADCDYNAELLLVEEIRAGALPKSSISRYDCARIFTGAPMPDGADAVVMLEDTDVLGDCIQIRDDRVKAGHWVFPRGTEMRAGDVAIAAGTRLNAAAIGVLAGIGASEVNVYPRTRVAVIATGDELVRVNEQPGPGQIRNSNGAMLAAQAVSAGAEVSELGIARDTLDDLKKIIGSALDTSEVVLLAGGVSAGNFDLVPIVLEELGMAALFHKVRMKPGKPLLFGTFGNTLVFGLPGNPVSAFVCFELFVRPALRRLAGEMVPGPRSVLMPLAEAIAEANDRPTYRPATLENGTVRPLQWAGSPDLRGIARADALIVLPAGESRLDAGMLVNVIGL